eukprot:jgi/Mesvir1/3422/Mv11924-RA.1
MAAVISPVAWCCRHLGLARQASPAAVRSSASNFRVSAIAPTSARKGSCSRAHYQKHAASHGRVSVSQLASSNFIQGGIVSGSCRNEGCGLLGGARLFHNTVRVSMSLKAGIVGLPNVGKSTLFNAMVVNGKAQAENFPFCTIEPNVGLVPVDDARLAVLSKLSGSKKLIPAQVEFVDIAGLVKGASEGQGLGNKFLSHIREVDAIVHVVRCFEDNDIIHVAGKVDPVEDTDVINLELALADAAQIEKRLERLGKGRSKDATQKKKEEEEIEVLKLLEGALQDAKPVRSYPLTDEQKELIKPLCLLTAKPMLYAANVPEEDLADQAASNKFVQALRKKAEQDKCDVVVVSAQVEAELIELDEAERKEFLASLGATEGGLATVVRAAYNILGLRTYFTTGEKETRAWTIHAGMTAPQAAGVIHTDFERGFIRAETVAYDDYVKAGSLAAARESGLLRLEGKEYVVAEGDVMLFRFNV